MKVLYVLFLLDTLNLAVYLPIFGAFVRSAGGTPFTLGLINSSSALITLLWNPVAGSLSDQVGRKGLLFKCMLASAFGSLILSMSSSSLILIFIARLIGAMGSPATVLLRSSVADIFKTDEEKKSFLNKSAPLISLGFLLGSLGSGFLSEAKNGYVLAFLLMAVIMGSASFITYTKLPAEIKPKTKPKNTTSVFTKAVQEMKTAVVNIKSISWPRYRDLFYMRGFADLGMATVFSNVGLLLIQEFEVKGRMVGLVFLMIGICRMVSALLKLRLKNVIADVPDHRLVFYAGVLQLVSFLGMALSTSFYTFLMFLGITSLVKPFTDTTFAEMIATKTQETDRGKVIAAFDNLFPFSMFVAPLVSGLVAEIVGFRLLLAFAAVPISISIWVSYRQRYKTE